MQNFGGQRMCIKGHLEVAYAIFIEDIRSERV